MYKPKRIIPEETLRLYEPVEVPEDLLGIGSAFLADLHDLVMKFGAILSSAPRTCQLYVRDDWHVLLRVSIDAQNRRMEIVGPGGKRPPGSHRMYYRRSDAFVDWDTRLTVDRVAGLIGHVDGLMLCQRLVDVETGERTQAIGRNDFTPPSKWVADDLPEPFSFLRVPPEADHQAMIDFFDHPEQVAYIATRNGYGLICRAENVPVMQRANAQAVKLVESYRKRGEYLQDEPRLVQELEAFMRDLLGPR